jgi:hypothetical protein
MKWWTEETGPDGWRAGGWNEPLGGQLQWLVGAVRGR